MTPEAEPRTVSKGFYTPFEHRYGAIETEPVACGWCGSASYRLLGTENGFEIRACRDCSLVYVSPQPTVAGLEGFYEDFYADRDAARSFGDVERHLRRFIQRRYPNGGRLLDVGCGMGTLLAAVDAPGWELYGVDLSETALTEARAAVPNAALTAGVFDENFFPGVAFDCITLIAVLEHAKDPKGVVANLVRKLRPGGTLLIQTPYIRYFFALSRRFPLLPAVPFEAPRHLFDFPPGIMRRLLASNGLVDVSVAIGRPYCGPNTRARLAIWATKLPGMVLHGLSGGRYVYPFAGSVLSVGRRPVESTYASGGVSNAGASQ